MAYEQVDVYVEDAAQVGVPIDGVLVRIYDVTGTTQYTEATTDATGRAGFLLSDQAYTMRFYRYQTSFKQPQHFVVETNPDTPGTTPNAFTVKASVHDRPSSPDSRLCRASGFFRDAAGGPRQCLDIHFIADFRPAIIDNALFMDERRTIKTNANGYGCIDLVRCACYSVTLEGFEDDVRFIRVPDAPSVNLADVLFPIIARVAQPSVTLAVGEEVELEPTVYDSAGVPRQGIAREDLYWTIEDSAVALMTLTPTRILLKGVTAGTTRIVAVRRDASIVKIPNTGIAGIPIEVVVS